MKRLMVAILFTATFHSAAFSREKPKPLLARVTVYWASGGRGSDRYTRQHKSATGNRLKTGHCAVDPRKIPYGSKIVLADGTALAAVDTGTAVRNRKAARVAGRTVTERNAIVIDRFFETKRQALTWANSHPHFMPVQVVPPATQTVANSFQPASQRQVLSAATGSSVGQPSLNSRRLVANDTTAAANPFNQLGRN